MQLPGPTLVVNEGTAVTITLTNNLPTGAGNTSIVFAGIPVTSATGGTAGLLAQEALPGGSVTYTLNTTGKAGNPCLLQRNPAPTCRSRWGCSVRSS